ncbi:uncharacterized protein [Spinacia oleracea]|uniref:Uncharacterized protein n=1 Tax=Spinacia oleracea TaxID=3562 RepID=A0ABM3QQ91_SPIOL|nr:uncharacterized protein LOC130461434 [Spinacia oleracea]
MEGLIQGAEDGKPMSPTVRTEDSEFQTMEGLIKGAEDGNPMSPTVRTEESEFKTPTAAESQTEMETPSIFLNTPSAVYSQPENAPTSMNIEYDYCILFYKLFFVYYYKLFFIIIYKMFFSFHFVVLFISGVVH